MQFNSFVFVVFLALFFSGWPLARRTRLSRYLYLIGFNLLFYGWWDWRYCILLLAVGISTWLLGAAIHRWPRHSKHWLAASVVLNLGLLGVYKYLGFFTLNLNALLKPLGTGLPLIELALPIGISFYTFMALSYTLDIKRGRLEPTDSLLHFLAYLTLFPQLLAGPITRAATCCPSFAMVPHPPQLSAGRVRA
jgi:D-alanyl-lipoteichoic acid acyltransferase DltB (MBOAT superfamily)